MTADDREALTALLVQMRAIHEQLADHHAGICVLHLEAAVAALESHLLRGGASMIDALRPALSAGLAH